MRPETILLIAMFVVLVFSTITLQALWQFSLHGYMVLPFAHWHG